MAPERIIKSLDERFVGGQLFGCGLMGPGRPGNRPGDAGTISGGRRRLHLENETCLPSSLEFQINFRKQLCIEQGAMLDATETEEYRRFTEIRRSDGLKAAIRWREAQFED